MTGDGKTGAFVDAAKDGISVEEADFVIVGSGAGGGAAARTLAGAGRSVVVLEEGPRVEAEALSPIVRESMARLFRQGGKMAAFGRATTPILQGRCVGGTTFVNSAIVWRIPDQVLDRWHAEHGLGEGLPAAELEAAYAAVEAELHVHAVEDEVTGRSDRLMQIGAAAMGIEHRTIRRNEQGCRGSGRCLHGCPHGAKQSTAQNQLRQAVADGAQVVAQARVERVLLDGDKAVGVEGRVAAGPRAGERFRVRARRAVVVAASAIQSPNLLRRSGLGRLAHLGEHFMAHPGTAIMALYPSPVNMWRGAAQGYEAFGLRERLGVKIETINVPPEVAASRLPGAGRRLARWIERLDHLATWAVALRADAVGRVRPSWLFGDKVSYQLLESDVARLRLGLKAVAEMHFRAGAIEVLPNVYGLPEVLTSPDQLEVFDRAPLDARAYGMLATHLFGGCRAGRDPDGSVVDPTLRVHGLRGLYVMDASVFPTNTGVNPQHGIMAVATVAARRLAAA